jgi:hypothetical protein
MALVMKINFTEIVPPHNEVKGEGLNSCDAITNSSRQSSLEIIEFVHFIKAYSYVSFCELFILWIKLLIYICSMIV